MTHCSLAFAATVLAIGCTVPVPTAEPDATASPDTAGDGDATDNVDAEPAEPPDAAPIMTVTGVTVEEGDALAVTARFEVSLSKPSPEMVTVDFTTADDTATDADGDYTPTAGTLTIPAGSTSATVEVQVPGDFRSERTEQFTLLLSNGSGATVENPNAVGQVKDDDGGSDFNGDGIPDILVGDSRAGNVDDGLGRAYLFFGNPQHEPGGAPDVLSATNADVVFSSEVADSDPDSFGSALALGDVNGDGFDDAIVGATTASPVAMVYVFSGSASPTSAVNASSADRTVELGSGHSWSLDVVDIDADGIDDLVIGGSEGAYLFAGSETFTAGPDLQLGDATATFVDAQVSRVAPWNAGDFDGNGNDDLLFTTSSSVNQEVGYLFLGGGKLEGQIGLAAANVIFDVNAGGVLIGSGGGDFNGDGIADVAIGSPDHDLGDGSVQVFFGRKEPPRAVSADVTIAAHIDGREFGKTVALAGDLNGDGRGELIAGSKFGGQTFLFLGRADFSSSSDSSVRDVVIDESPLNSAIAVLDFNGDGFHDLALGANGEAYLFLGFAGGFQGIPAMSGADADVRFESAPDGSAGFGGFIAH